MASVCISSGLKYTTDFTPCIQSTDANTLLLWKFQNVTGNTVSDESGNGYDLQLYNGPTSVSDAPSQTCSSCTATDDVVVTVNPQDDATFAYSASSYCSDDNDPTPTISGTTGGTFSSTAGLVMTNGVIDLDASTAGSYTIKYVTTGTCPDSSNQDVTITTPSTDFNYGGATEFCIGTTNPVATITGGSGGTFTATGGLTIDANTGEIDLSAANPGNYQVTYTPPSNWQQRGQDIDGEGAGDWSGISVSLSSEGNKMAIGANQHSGNGRGYVRIFENIGGTWSQIGQDIDGEGVGDYSGNSVSISSDGSKVAIGASGNGRG